MQTDFQNMTADDMKMVQSLLAPRLAHPTHTPSTDTSWQKHLHDYNLQAKHRPAQSAIGDY